MSEQIKEKQDLTTGSLWKKILLFSLPLMLSNLLQVLFNMADVAVVGQFAGAMALGSVGSTTTLVTLFTGFLIGLPYTLQYQAKPLILCENQAFEVQQS